MSSSERHDDRSVGRVARSTRVQPGKIKKKERERGSTILVNSSWPFLRSTIDRARPAGNSDTECRHKTSTRAAHEQSTLPFAPFVPLRIVRLRACAYMCVRAYVKEREKGRIVPTGGKRACVRCGPPIYRHPSECFDLGVAAVSARCERHAGGAESPVGPCRCNSPRALAYE